MRCCMILERLIEVVLPYIIGVYHCMEKLTPKEQNAQKNFVKKLSVQKRKTAKPLIVAFIGLIGSGKSSVARELTKHIGGTVICGDNIRIELRKQKEKYDHARIIAGNVALEVVNNGGNAILDSDFVDGKKRASIREKAQKVGAKLIFIRTYCDFDVVVGRILTTRYKDCVEDFFGGASSKWKGGEQLKGVVVKIRELWRRTPQHYRWTNKVGGKWILKKFSFNFFAEIDTTNEERWRQEVKKYAKTLDKK